MPKQDRQESVSDRSLIRRAIGGDGAAFGVLVQRYDAMLCRFAAGRLAGADGVDEVVQQTWIRVWEQLARFREQEDFGIWLRTICRYMAMSYLKEKMRERRRSTCLADRLACRLAEQSMVLLAEDHCYDRLAVCLDRLGSPGRDLVEGYYRHQLDCEQLASQFGRTAGWVSTTLHRVRKVLAECMGKTEQTDG